jgi:hypothetical protein
MWAPAPSREDGWFVLPGLLRGGKEIDLFRWGTRVTYAKPLFTSRTFWNSRWRQFFMFMAAEDLEKQKLFFGRYICREWNSEHQNNPDLTLKEFKIVFMQEMTAPNYGISTPQPIVLWEHFC